jgi:pimeloyl-ACP methyl ester carboxylesterase
MSHDSNKLPTKIGNDQSSDCVIIFVNGLGGGRDTWEELSLFLKNNWQLDFTFDLKYYHPYNDKSKIHSFIENLNRKTKLGKYLLFLYRVLIGERIENLANGLSSYIEMNCHSYEKILLVGHSMGGLVSRKMIVNELQKSHSVNINKLITYATPHLGSKIAAFFGITIQIRQMNIFSSKFLTDLNEDWYELSAQNHVNPTYVIATKDSIVNNVSASGVDKDPHLVYAIGQSHTSLIKPVNIDDIGYATLVKCITETFIESELSSTGGIEDFDFNDVDIEEDENFGLPNEEGI